MKLRDSIRNRDYIYKVGIIIGIILIVAITLFRTTDIERYITGGMPECYFRKISGVICPGCGMTRAVKSMFKLKFVKSMLYHIIPVYSLVCFIYLMIKETLHKINGSKKVTERLFLNLIYVGIGLDLIQWMIKLVCIYVFKIKML